MSALRDALRDLPDAVFADLLESDDAYRLVIDLPGVTADNLDLRTDGGRLRIDARREKPYGPGYKYVAEDRSLFLDADLPLPPDATGEEAIASIDNGVLEVTLPKQTATSGTQIDVEDA